MPMPPGEAVAVGRAGQTRSELTTHDTMNERSPWLLHGGKHVTAEAAAAQRVCRAQNLSAACHWPSCAQQTMPMRTSERPPVRMSAYDDDTVVKYAEERQHDATAVKNWPSR